MNIIKKLPLILLGVTICLGLVLTTYQPVAAAVDNPQNCTRWHTVQRGEYLSLIADIYDTYWSSIAAINKLSNPSLIFPNQKLCIFYSGSVSAPPNSIPSTSASVSAVSVKEDKAVTLQGNNLSANSSYKIYLGRYKSSPGYSFLVGTVTADKNGAFKATFNIPKQLSDVMKIRVSVTNSRGVSTSNWFINATSTSNTGGINSPALGLTVNAVKKGEWVKISTKNLPPNVSFHIYLNKYGAAQKKAILVGTLRDSKGGSITASFEIPDSIKGKSQLEISAVNKSIDVTAKAVFSNTTKKQ